MKKLGKDDKRRMQELVKEVRRAQKNRDSAAIRRNCDLLEQALTASGQNLWNEDARPGEDSGYDATYEPADGDEKK